MVDGPNGSPARKRGQSGSSANAGTSGPAPLPLQLVGLRVAQFLFDLAIVAVLCYLCTLLMHLLPKAPDGTYSNPVAPIGMSLVVLLAAALVNIAYWVGLPARSAGQTIGMRLFRLQVVNSATREPGSATQLALRMILLAADAMFFGLVGLLAMLSSPLRQRLGDVVAGTQVVRAAVPAMARNTAPAGPARPDATATGAVPELGRDAALGPLGITQPGTAQP